MLRRFGKWIQNCIDNQVTVIQQANHITDLEKRLTLQFNTVTKLHELNLILNKRMEELLAECNSRKQAMIEYTTIKDKLERDVAYYQATCKALMERFAELNPNRSPVIEPPHGFDMQRHRSVNQASVRQTRNPPEILVPLSPYSDKLQKYYDYHGLISFRITTGRGEKCILNLYAIKEDGSRGDVHMHSLQDSVESALKTILLRTGFAVTLTDTQQINPEAEIITTRDSFTMTGVDMANGSDETVTQTVKGNHTSGKQL